MVGHRDLSGLVVRRAALRWLKWLHTRVEVLSNAEMRRQNANPVALAAGLLLVACAGREPPKRPSSPVEIPAAKSVAEHAPETGAELPKRSTSRAIRWMDRPPGSDEDRRKAAAIFDEATAAIRREGHSAEACALFEECLALDPAIGALMNLAACRDAIGDKQTACELYAEAVDWAERNQRKAVAERARAQLKSGNCPALPP